MDINETIETPGEPKIRVELSENGDVQFTIPEAIMDRNIPEITYTTFRDIDTGDYIYQLSLHLTEKQADSDDDEEEYD